MMIYDSLLSFRVLSNLEYLLLDVFFSMKSHVIYLNRSLAAAALSL